jgi:hypothetical protein
MLVCVKLLEKSRSIDVVRVMLDEHSALQHSENKTKTSSRGNDVRKYFCCYYKLLFALILSLFDPHYIEFSSSLTMLYIFVTRTKKGGKILQNYFDDDDGIFRVMLFSLSLSDVTLECCSLFTLLI